MDFFQSSIAKNNKIPVKAFVRAPQKDTIDSSLYPDFQGVIFPRSFWSELYSKESSMLLLDMSFGECTNGAVEWELSGLRSVCDVWDVREDRWEPVLNKLQVFSALMV